MRVTQRPDTSPALTYHGPGTTGRAHRRKGRRAQYQAVVRNGSPTFRREVYEEAAPRQRERRALLIDPDTHGWMQKAAPSSRAPDRGRIIDQVEEAAVRRQPGAVRLRELLFK
jgi:hypothetical protein